MQGLSCFLPTDPLSQTHLQPDPQLFQPSGSERNIVENGAAMTTQSHQSPPDRQQVNDQPIGSRKKKHYDIHFYTDWCKACGICMAFCPQQIIQADENGKPVVPEPDGCIGCRFCETHCPDFAITVSERKAKRRRDNG